MCIYIYIYIHVYIYICIHTNISICYMGMGQDLIPRRDHRSAKETQKKTISTGLMLKLGDLGD